MPILQNKLVMKSIEALHDEALSLVPDNASNRGATVPPAVLTAAPLQESSIDAPSNQSKNAPSEAAIDHDIVARIDHLLKKLDLGRISMCRHDRPDPENPKEKMPNE